MNIFQRFFLIFKFYFNTCLSFFQKCIERLKFKRVYKCAANNFNTKKLTYEDCPCNRLSSYWICDEHRYIRNLKLKAYHIVSSLAVQDVDISVKREVELIARTSYMKQFNIHRIDDRHNQWAQHLAKFVHWRWCYDTTERSTYILPVIEKSLAERREYNQYKYDDDKDNHFDTNESCSRQDLNLLYTRFLRYRNAYCETEQEIPTNENKRNRKSMLMIVRNVINLIRSILKTIPTTKNDVELQKNQHESSVHVFPFNKHYDYIII